jgi:hypothetical protein
LLEIRDTGGLASRCFQPDAFLQHLFHHWRCISAAIAHDCLGAGEKVAGANRIAADASL